MIFSSPLNFTLKAMAIKNLLSLCAKSYNIELITLTIYLIIKESINNWIVERYCKLVLIKFPCLTTAADYKNITNKFLSKNYIQYSTNL